MNNCDNELNEKIMKRFISIPIELLKDEKLSTCAKLVYISLSLKKGDIDYTTKNIGDSMPLLTKDCRGVFDFLMDELHESGWIDYNLKGDELTIILKTKNND